MKKFTNILTTALTLIAIMISCVTVVFAQEKEIHEKMFPTSLVLENTVLSEPLSMLETINLDFEEKKSGGENVKDESVYYYKVSAQLLNVRTGPSVEDNVKEVLGNDWVVESSMNEGEWIELSSGGFVNKKYLDEISEELAEKLYEKQSKTTKEDRVSKIIARINKENYGSAREADTKNDDGGVIDAFSEYEIDLLARLVRAESNTEPFEGKVAVATVVLNRVYSDKFPDSIEAVIYQPKQFQVVSNKSVFKPANAESRKAAEYAIRNYNPNNDGSLYFYNANIVSSSWFESLTTTKVIGNHTFKY